MLHMALSRARANQCNGDPVNASRLHKPCNPRLKTIGLANLTVHGPVGFGYLYLKGAQVSMSDMIGLSLAVREVKTQFSFHFFEETLSSWSESGAKRLFDLVCALILLPLLIPVFLVIALAILVTSRGPVLFLQGRVGRYNRSFTILKFRTLEHREEGTHNSVTTAENQRFTLVGPFLRRWKLDELPQLLNVLMGDMSFVGPRPKLPEHQLGRLRCRPGLTGSATLAFSREEQVLTGLPHHRLDEYYHAIILPAKLRLDTEYMARATFLSDLKLIVNTAFRRWDATVMQTLLDAETVEIEPQSQSFEVLASRANCEAIIADDQSLVSAD
jgi:lipopolysaccharide/colanic/teichoic acid biosynthesis glycosyltransferase